MATCVVSKHWVDAASRASLMPTAIAPMCDVCIHTMNDAFREHVVLVALFWHEGVLMDRRSQTVPCPGQWEMHGGNARRDASGKRIGETHWGNACWIKMG